MDKVIYLERMLSIYILECKPISFYKNFTIVSSVTGVKVFYNILINAATSTIMWHLLPCYISKQKSENNNDDIELM